MRFLFYTHSLASDWNNGNAHFQRGIMRALLKRGHEAFALEPADGWSRVNLVAEAGSAAIEKFGLDFPTLRTHTYDELFAHEDALDEADVVLVHEWTDPALVRRIGRARRSGGRFTLLFHDTHHRAITSRSDIATNGLDDFDGVLAFGQSLRETYVAAGWGRRVFTWHEAADVDLFKPHIDVTKSEDVAWIGNWGDDERAAELQAFFVQPVKDLKLRANAYGVRYPREALADLRDAGIIYRGWAPNAHVPHLYARHRVALHVPRRPYVAALPGIPTIRMFEALACGITLVSAPWTDSESLFNAGSDYLCAASPTRMKTLLRDVLQDRDYAHSIGQSGMRTIAARHTCAHRAIELEGIVAKLKDPVSMEPQT